MAHLVVAAVVGTTCAAPFQVAMQEGTVLGWRRFLAQAHSEEEAEAGRDALCELLFQEARQVHTLVAYKRFLEECPSGDRAAAATKLLETLRYGAAEQNGTAAAWRQFLKDHPDGAHRQEALSRLAPLELAELASAEVSERAEFLRQKYAGTPEAEKALRRRDDWAFGCATSAQALFGYLDAFPAGAHRDDAKRKLLWLEVSGLLFFGELERAKSLVASSPLAAEDQTFAALLRSKSSKKLARNRPTPVREEAVVLNALKEADTRERWEAAEELEAYPSSRTLDVLWIQIRQARSFLVRKRAFESLQHILRLMPEEVAEFEVRRRVRLQDGMDENARWSRGVLLDAAGHLEEREARALLDVSDDIFVRWRMMNHRRQRGQNDAAAMSAKQLVAWAKAVSDENSPVPLPRSRELCAALEAVKDAESLLDAVSKAQLDFPEDTSSALLQARQTRTLIQAQLRDAELEMLAHDRDARLCEQRDVRARLSTVSVRPLAWTAATPCPSQP